MPDLDGDRVAHLIADADAARVVATEARADGERELLLRRIAGARVPTRTLARLIVEVEGLGAFSDNALRRMGEVLDVIEAPASKRPGTLWPNSPSDAVAAHSPGDRE